MISKDQGWPPRPPKDIDLLCVYKSYTHGQKILSEGQPGNRVCFLLKGRCKIYTSGLNGQILIQNVVRAPEVFGMIEQFRGLNNVCTVEAFGDVETWEVPRRAYLEWVTQDLDFAIKMLSRVSDIAYNQIEHQSVNILSPLMQRFLGYLIANAEGKPSVVVDKQELAGRLATTVRHLNRTIQKCIKDGIVAYEGGKILIDHWDKLVAYKDQTRI